MEESSPSSSSPAEVPEQTDMPPPPAHQAEEEPASSSASPPPSQSTPAPEPPPVNRRSEEKEEEENGGIGNTDDAYFELAMDAMQAVQDRPNFGAPGGDMRTKVAYEHLNEVANMHKQMEREINMRFTQFKKHLEKLPASGLKVVMDAWKTAHATELAKKRLRTRIFAKMEKYRLKVTFKAWEHDTKLEKEVNNFYRSIITFRPRRLLNIAFDCWLALREEKIRLKQRRARDEEVKVMTTLKIKSVHQKRIYLRHMRKMQGIAFGGLVKNVAMQKRARLCARKVAHACLERYLGDTLAQWFLTVARFRRRRLLLATRTRKMEFATKQAVYGEMWTACMRRRRWDELMERLDRRYAHRLVFKAFQAYVSTVYTLRAHRALVAKQRSTRLARRMIRLWRDVLNRIHERAHQKAINNYYKQWAADLAKDVRTEKLLNRAQRQRLRIVMRAAFGGFAVNVDMCRRRRHQLACAAVHNMRYQRRQFFAAWRTMSGLKASEDLISNAILRWQLRWQIPYVARWVQKHFVVRNKKPHLSKTFARADTFKAESVESERGSGP